MLDFEVSFEILVGLVVADVDMVLFLAAEEEDRMCGLLNLLSGSC